LREATLIVHSGPVFDMAVNQFGIKEVRAANNTRRLFL
jgi:hypothetical protein